MKQMRLIIHGRVQGVFFRDNTQKLASKLGVVGFVRNCSDGTVEVVAQGSDSALKELLEYCKKGPMIARVEKVDVEYSDAEESFDSFEVRY